jgi:hypothetical protein
MIRICPYQTVNEVHFGSSESEVTAAFGEPSHKRVNQEAEIELHYTNYIIRLDAETRLFREFTLLPGCVARVNDVDVDWNDTFLSVVQRIDPELVEVLGFVLSLKLGLSFSGFHDGDLSQMAIHAFQRGDWDRFRKRMKPFHFSSSEPDLKLV